MENEQIIDKPTADIEAQELPEFKHSLDLAVMRVPRDPEARARHLTRIENLTDYSVTQIGAGKPVAEYVADKFAFLEDVQREYGDTEEISNLWDEMHGDQNIIEDMSKVEQVSVLRLFLFNRPETLRATHNELQFFATFDRSALRAVLSELAAETKSQGGVKQEEFLNKICQYLQVDNLKNHGRGAIVSATPQELLDLQITIASMFPEIDFKLSATLKSE